jgi:D-glycero-D-manno-heptose 1,7-bisphosphate phosphatase
MALCSKKYSKAFGKVKRRQIYLASFLLGQAMNKAIFLDRDGVINHTVFRMGKPRAPYTFDEFSFIDGVIPSIKAFKEAGYLIIVATNQPDVARGWVSRAQVDLINAHVKTCLPVDEIMAC